MRICVPPFRPTFMAIVKVLIDKRKMETQSKIPVTDCIYLKNDQFYCKYMYSEIQFIEAAGSYCNVHLSSNSGKLVLAITLAELKEYLPTEIFIRSHRSYIININHIERILGNIIYINETSIPIGREHKKNIFSLLNIVGL